MGRRSLRAVSSSGKLVRQYEAPLPGALLLKQFKKMGITQRYAARCMGIADSNLNDYIHGLRGFSIAFALRLEKAFGFNPEHWLSMQVKFDLQQCREDHRIRKMLSRVKANQ